MKIEDVLAPWEYSPNAPATLCEIYQFAIESNGKQVPIVAALIESVNYRYLCFRLETDDASWTLGNKNLGGTETFLLQFAPSLENVELRVNAAIKRNLIYRQFALDFDEGPESLWAVNLSPLGNGYWRRQLCGQFVNYETRFRFSGGELFESKAQTWRDELNSELENPESDAAFARQILLQKPSYRLVERYGMKSKGQSKLSSLWKLVVLNHKGEWENMALSQRVGHSVYLEVRGQVEEEKIGELDISLRPSNRRLQLWAELLVEYGPTQFDFEVFNNYTALRDIFESEGYQLRVFVDSPTSHERLEAKIQLLEWAKTHLPPEKYAEVKAMET